MTPKKKSQEEQQRSPTNVAPPKQLLWCADVISVVAEFLPPTDRHQKPLMLVSKLWLDGVAQQLGMQVLHDVHWPFAALRHRGSRKLKWSPHVPALSSSADLEQLVINLPSHQVCSLKLEQMDSDMDVTCLWAMENLTQLCWRFSREMPRGVGYLRSLRTLRITSPFNVSDCETISELTCLEELSVYCCSNSLGIPPAGLNHILKLKKLRKLSLDAGMFFNDAHMKVISQMTQLTELDCNLKNDSTDEVMVWLSRLANLTSMRLYGFKHSVTGKGLRLLGKLKKLTYFYLNFRSHNSIGNEDLVFFNELQELESFDLKLNDLFTLTDEGLGHIAGARSLRKLELWLMTSTVTTAGLRHLERLPKLKVLHDLTAPNAELRRLEMPSLEDLSVLNATDVVLHDISLLRTLTVLSIQESPDVTDEGVQHLSSLANLEKLTLIELPITGSGFADFHKLRKLKHLKILDCYNLQDQAMHHICEISSLETLEVIDCHRLTDNAFSPIAKLRNVGRLTIWWCSAIHDNIGLMSIAGMKSLESLSITDCSITSEFLRSLRSNETLRYFDVSFHEEWNGKLRFTAKDVEELMERKKGAELSEVGGRWKFELDTDDDSLDLDDDDDDDVEEGEESNLLGER